MNHFRQSALCLLVTILLLFSCTDQKAVHRKEAQDFLDSMNNKYHELYTASSESQWLVNTHIVEGDTMNAFLSGRADEALAKFTGSKENVSRETSFLKC